MNVDLNDIDDKLKQISPNELDHLQQATMDAKSAEDDIAIAEAISQIEAELNEDETAHRTSIFDSEGVDVDLNGIDANLQQITPKEHAFNNQQKNDQISAEDDLAITQAINEVESELKKGEPSMFNTTTVMMMVVAGGIIASRLVEEYFKRA